MVLRYKMKVRAQVIPPHLAMPEDLRHVENNADCTTVHYNLRSVFLRGLYEDLEELKSINL